MPYVTCPSCGERGKIAPSLLGARIKCKQCGGSFQVSPQAPAPAARATAGLTSKFPEENVDGPHGIAVEGLDASSWSLATDVENISIARATSEPDEREATTAAFAPAAAASATEERREYKVLTPRDKFFDGKFDLARLEEALNHFARQGWRVKSMSTPHVKGFTGVLEETIVVLLER